MYLVIFYDKNCNIPTNYGVEDLTSRLHSISLLEETLLDESIGTLLKYILIS